MNSDASAQCQEVIERHQTILDAHWKFLSSLKLDSQAQGGTPQLLQECLSETDKMSQCFKAIAARFDNSSIANPTSNSQHNVMDNRPKKRLPTGPRHDSGGSLDPTFRTTPVEVLPGRPFMSAVIRTKRKASVTDENVRDPQQLVDELHERPQKKMRTGDVPIAKFAAGLQEESIADENHLPHDPTKVSPAGDSFVQQVEERLRKKELKRLKKQERKRKRESRASDITMTGIEQDGTKTVTEGQKPKRVKVTHQFDQLPTTTTSAASETASQSGQSIQSVTAATNKRASPAAEYIGALLKAGMKTRNMRRKTGDVA